MFFILPCVLGSLPNASTSIGISISVSFVLGLGLLSFNIRSTADLETENVDSETGKPASETGRWVRGANGS